MQQTRPSVPVLQVVLAMDVDDLDRFFARVDQEPDESLEDAGSHWLYRPDFEANKTEGFADLLAYNGLKQRRGLNARRIAYILHYEGDPGKQPENRCGVECCVNPAHTKGPK